IENPASGYLQSCNSTPFYTTDEGNPSIGDFPSYMGEDWKEDKRRSKVSRRLLREMRNITFEEFEKKAFDTTVYWALVQLPRLRREFQKLKETHPDLAAKAAPYFEHFDGWDYRMEHDSTQGSLCLAWYWELYGTGYPGETIKSKFRKEPHLKFQALIDAAAALKKFHNDWKVPYGKIHRLQRHADVADFYQIPFDDKLPSVPCVGAPGPLGVVFTVYYTPSIVVPFVRRMRNHYAIVGTSYLSVVEFGDKIRARSALPYGASANPESPHFDDQAKLFSERRLKPAYFYWDDVMKHARKVYHPGEK
ncbi:MAG: penicillin acylase family protein, partial [Planctomycetota bacterium]